MSSNYAGNSADPDPAHGTPQRKVRLTVAQCAPPAEEGENYSTRMLNRLSLRSYGNTHTHAALMQSMQHTYGNRQTRRAVQRAVTINEITGDYVESEYDKAKRQRDMTEEQKVKEMTDQTDQLDESWSIMNGQERQRMIDSENESTRQIIDMQAAGRGTGEDYARCPNPSKSYCGLEPPPGFPRDPEENPIPELNF